jgi:uncharacterized membrane protein
MLKGFLFLHGQMIAGRESEPGECDTNSLETGGSPVSWLACFRALQLAPAAWVAPIDTLSLPLTVLLAALVLREPVTCRPRSARRCWLQAR